MAQNTGLVVRYLKTFWRPLVLLLTPLVSTLVFINQNQVEAMKVLYVLVIMAVYWVTEALPVPITALIPIAALPLLGVMPTQDVTINYMKAINVLFMGGLMMAIAVENSGLHRRISIIMLQLFGTTRGRIMMSFMLATGFLSMIISNTAATAMMLPIVEAVVITIDEAERKKELETAETDATELSPHGKARRRLLMLSVAYAANVGGTGFLTGSPPNLVLPQKLSDEWPDHPLNFLTWSCFSIPLMLCNLFLSFVWLSFFDRLQGGGRSQAQSTSGNHKTNDVQLRNYGTNNKEGEEEGKEVPPKSEHNENNKIKDIIKQEYKSLGPWSVAEITVGLSFFVLLLLWLFKEPGGAKGWIAFFPYDYTIDDATSTILVVLIVFALPSGYYFWPFQPLSEEPRASEPLLEWSGEQGVEKRLQWGVILLLGGGFALSEACQRSGLSTLVGTGLSGLLEGLPIVISILIISTLTATFTEFASNTATANILVPILIAASKKLCLNPIYLTLPAVLSCSYAFMLPAATAPNAIVKETAGIPTFTMMKAGFVMNLLCVATTVIFVVSWGRVVFDFGQELPEWLTANNTDYANCTLQT